MSENQVDIKQRRKQLKRRDLSGKGSTLGPMMTWSLILFMFPLVYLLILSFTQHQLVGIDFTFTLENYEKVFTGSIGQTLLNSIIMAVVVTVIVIILAYPYAYFVAMKDKKKQNFLIFLIMIPSWQICCCAFLHTKTDVYRRDYQYGFAGVGRDFGADYDALYVWCRVYRFGFYDLAFYDSAGLFEFAKNRQVGFGSGKGFGRNVGSIVLESDSAHQSSRSFQRECVGISSLYCEFHGYDDARRENFIISVILSKVNSGKIRIGRPFGNFGRPTAHLLCFDYQQQLACACIFPCATQEREVDDMKRRRMILPNIYIFLILAILYIPVLILMAYSFNSNAYGAAWGGFTFDWYNTLFQRADVQKAVVTTLIVTSCSTVISIVIATLCAIGFYRYDFKGKNFLNSFLYLPAIVPPIVLGVALYMFYNFANVTMGIGTIMLAHVTFCAPYAFTTIKST
jgi:ABC-type spermidine/putrescine transport system permease subunit II